MRELNYQNTKQKQKHRHTVPFCHWMMNTICPLYAI